MNPPFEVSVEKALRSKDPFQELRILVSTLFAQGLNQAKVLEMFEGTRQQLRQAGKESDEDVVMEVMDCLVGWCSPPMKLSPSKQPQ